MIHDDTVMMMWYYRGYVNWPYVTVTIVLIKLLSIQYCIVLYCIGIFGIMAWAPHHNTYCLPPAACTTFTTTSLSSSKCIITSGEDNTRIHTILYNRQ